MGEMLSLTASSAISLVRQLRSEILATLGMRLPDWPAIMKPETAAAYLDCVGKDGRTRGNFADWKRAPGFPQPDPETGTYYKTALDAFLAQYFGYADPAQASRRELDRMFGT